MNISIDVRNISNEERQIIKQSLLDLGWELDITFNRMLLDSSYVFTWRKDTQPIYPKTIKYTIVN